MRCSIHDEVLSEDLQRRNLIPRELEATVAALERLVTEPMGHEECTQLLDRVSKDIEVHLLYQSKNAA